MAMEGVILQDRLLLCVICMSSHFSGWKDIFQSDSHLFRLLRSSWSSMQSEE